MATRGTRQGISVERVHIDRQGYDRRGRYWGVGQKLYRVSSENGDGHVRAANAVQARAKAKADRLVGTRGVRKRRSGRKCVAYSKTTHKCLRYAHPGANRDAARGYVKLRGVGKGRCKRWSKGRTRCLKRA